MTIPTTRDRLKTLLIRPEIITENLRENDLGIILVSATLVIPQATELSEREVTEKLHHWLETVGPNVRSDAVELRRYLIDFGCLTRDRAGHAYVRPAQWPEKLKEIASDLESLDINSFARQARSEEIERRAERKKAALEKKRDDSESK